MGSRRNFFRGAKATPSFPIHPLSTLSFTHCQAAQLNPTRGFGEGSIADYSENQLVLPFLPALSYHLLFPVSLPSHTLTFPSLPFASPFASSPLSFPVTYGHVNRSYLLTYFPFNLSLGGSGVAVCTVQGCANWAFYCSYSIEYLIEYSSTRLIPEVAINHRVVESKRIPGSSFKFVI